MSFLKFGTTALLFFSSLSSAADKTLYQCAAADGSIAFQETPCQGEPMQIIPIDEKEAAPLQFKNETCKVLARLVWKKSGELGQTEFGVQAQEELAKRRTTLRTQCGLELNPSPLAMDCATLSAAVQFTAAASPAGEGEQKADVASVDHVEKQFKTQCTDAAIEQDILRSIRAVQIDVSSTP
jgi:hypothetical protein